MSDSKDAKKKLANLKDFKKMLEDQPNLYRDDRVRILEANENSIRSLEAQLAPGAEV